MSARARVEPRRGSGVRLRDYCAHAGAREIRMYTSYAEANAVRLRLVLSATRGWRHVSTIYGLGPGWAWTICDECPANAVRAPAVGE